MPLRVLVVSLLGLVPLGGHADGAWQAPSALEAALGYLRPEKPRRGLETPQDNINLWRQSVGFGAQVEVAKNVALRVDLDRYRPRFPGAIGRESIDTVTLYLSFDSL